MLFHLIYHWIYPSISGSCIPLLAPCVTPVVWSPLVFRSNYENSRQMRTSGVSESWEKTGRRPWKGSHLRRFLISLKLMVFVVAKTSDVFSRLSHGVMLDFARETCNLLDSKHEKCGAMQEEFVNLSSWQARRQNWRVAWLDAAALTHKVLGQRAVR